MKAILLGFFLLLNLSLQAQKKHQAQSLEPQLLIQGRDTSHVFTMPQSRQMAKLIGAADFAFLEILKQKDQIKALKNKVDNQQSILVLKEQELEIYRESIQERDQLLGQYQVLDSLQRSELQRIDRQLRWQKAKTKAVGGLGIVGILATIALSL
jgi:hypothetical protein